MRSPQRSHAVAADKICSNEIPNYKNMKHLLLKMKAKQNNSRKFGLIPRLAVAMAMAVWMPATTRAVEPDHAQHLMMMNQIKTQAEADALKPGDSISMTCNSCKYVMVMSVTTGQEHIKMMTVGEKHICQSCKGRVDVTATGKGEGKNAEVKHVCSKCGDDAMFVCASKPGSGDMKDMEKGKK